MHVSLPAATTGENSSAHGDFRENVNSTKSVMTNSVQLPIHWEWGQVCLCRQRLVFNKSKEHLASRVWPYQKDSCIKGHQFRQTTKELTKWWNKCTEQYQYQCRFTEWYVPQHIFHFVPSLDRNKNTREKLGAAKSLQEMKEICQTLKHRVQVRIKIFIKKKSKQFSCRAVFLTCHFCCLGNLSSVGDILFDLCIRGEGEEARSSIPLCNLTIWRS